jgi:hypothetical protein
VTAILDLLIAPRASDQRVALESFQKYRQFIGESVPVVLR